VTSAPRIVLFTDLDGSLLDADTYSFDGARAALDELRRRSIPIVACTSKTAAETRHFLARLEVDAPFIVESGAGVYLPERDFAGLGPRGEARNGWRLVKLAVGYGEVLGALAEIRRSVQATVRGFHDLTAQEVADETGLSLEMARLARARDFDEPFRLEPETAASGLEALAARRGLRMSRGGRFWHLHGDIDKGRAVKLVLSLYAERWGSIRSIGAGDSAMDLPLLEAVEIPVVVARPDGTYDPILKERLRKPVLSEVPGAAGWSRGVLKALERFQNPA
jgi:mannosyl-3-phosphoglycerate phosphatase